MLLNYIKENGGATLGNDNYKRGFMVSFPNSEIVKKLEEITEDELTDLVNKGYNGFWVNNNSLFIDKSIRIRNKRKAIKLGKLYKQIAIYDIAKNKSIIL